MKVVSIRKMLDILSFGALVLYVLDIILFGSGLVTMVYSPISSRFLFFAVAIIAALPRLWERKRELIKNKSIILFAIFLFYAAVMGVYGYLNGNRVDFIIADLGGYINIAILPVMMVMLETKEKINTFLKFVFCGALFIALLSFLFSFMRFFPQGISSYLMNRLTIYEISQLTYLSGNVTRVFFDTGTRYMFTAFVIGFYFIVSKNKPNKFVVSGCAVILASLFISYARELYLGIIVAVVFVFILIGIFAKDYLKNAIKSMAAIVVISVMLIAGLSLLQKENLFYVGLSESFTGLNVNAEGRVDSTDINKEDNLEFREMIKDNAIKAIKESPFIGNGLGLAVEENVDRVGYSYYDICAKMGIVGLILFVSPFLALLFELFKKRKRVSEHTLMFQSLMFVSSIFVFVISYFSPCINSAVGISVFSLSAAVIDPSNRWDIKPETFGELSGGEH